MKICCEVCGGDPAGRWAQPALLIFVNSPDDDGKPHFRCRSHASPECERRIQASERDFR
jgi:hypothetical protein